MRLELICTVTCALVVSTIAVTPPESSHLAAPTNNSNHLETSADWLDFKAWQLEFNKTNEYSQLSSGEIRRRFAVFMENIKVVGSHNKAGSSFTMKINIFGDMTRQEFKTLHTGLRRSRGSEAMWEFNQSQSGLVSVVPKEFDWRTKGVVSSIKNQFEPHSCGSCWAFSAISGVESRYAMDGNKVVSFSAQNLIDCTLNGTDTCNKGGEMHDGVMQVAQFQQGKVNTAQDYPYTGLSKGECHYNDKTAFHTNITGYANVTVGDEVALLNALVLGGVIPAGINSDADAFMFYSGGIIDIPASKCPNGPNDLDHGVAIVGFGTDSGKDYWIVKNSYGKFWGEKGYFRIIRGENLCGIATDCIVVLK